MTIGILAKRGNDIVIGADTLELMGGSHKQYGTKLIQIKDCWIATCGLSNVQAIIEGFTRSKDWVENFKYDSIEDIESFADEVWDALKERMDKWPTDSAKKDWGDEEFILATPNKAFRACGFGLVWEVKDYVCIGSGSSYAYGAMRMGYSKKSCRLQDIVQECLHIATYYDASCGGDVEVKIL